MNILKNVKDNIFADEGTRSVRLNTCKECQYLIQATNRCGVCGCFVIAKTKLKKSSCPKGKW